ncbi:metalloprotease mig-17-like [Argopecten irradians]|uniref:metalloprotease mig-17-like n=1 Tax=Argopecten irradians TaxID=31199 RepID=UPI0037226FD1
MTRVAALSLTLSIMLQLLENSKTAGSSENKQEGTFNYNIRVNRQTVTSSHPQHMNFVIEDQGQKETLNLKRKDNIDINSPLCSLSQGQTLCEVGDIDNVAFYHSKDRVGAFSVKVNKNERRNKHIEGVFISEDKAHMVAPSSSLSHLLINESIHHITKRSSSFVASGRTVSILGRRMVNIVESSNHVNEYLNEMKEENSDYIVEVLIMIDYSLYKKFLDKANGQDGEAITQLRYYFAHIVNGMDLRYSSINNTDFRVSIRLAGFFVAKNKTDLPFVLTFRQGGDIRSKVDGSATLLGLTNFLKGKPNLPHHDHAMLFTEHDATNGRGHILGTSYLSGICTPMSTSVIVDHGSYNSAGIAAHELGHNLGVIYHDGDSSALTVRCPKELNYIMAPSSAIINSKTKEYSFKFSDCSIRQIELQMKKLSNRNRNCLAEDTGPSLATIVVKPYLMIPPGQIEDVHNQCRDVYGNSSFMCPPSSTDEMCYKMYCYDPKRKICITASEQRAAMGSSCGNKKWCKLGKCVWDDKAPSVPGDCPFPDVPPSRTKCSEEASPFRCRDPSFYRRCCESCNKNFTKEESCKDMKILINGLQCGQFIQRYGTDICTLDPNVMNFCCKSCTNPPAPTVSPIENNSYSHVTASTCTDNSFVRINGLECQDFISQNGRRVCDRDMINKHCCASCYLLKR